MLLLFFWRKGGLNHCNSFSHYGVSLTLRERKKSEDRRYSHFSDLPVLYILYGNLRTLNQFIQLKLNRNSKVYFTMLIFNTPIIQWRI